MRQCQRLVRTHNPLHVKEIEIDHARSPMLVSHAPECILDPLQFSKQGMRCSIKCDACSSIEKGRLIGLSPGRCFIK